MPYRVPKTVLSRTVDEEEVLLDISSQSYFGLNPTGTLVWSLLKRGLEGEDIARAVSETFGADIARARRDVSEFLDELEKQDLILREGK